MMKDFSSLFYNNPLPNWVYDPETLEILDVNQKAMALYGYEKKEFLSLSMPDLVSPEEGPTLKDCDADIGQEYKGIPSGTYTHRKKDGTPIRVALHGHSLDFLNRRSILVVGQDITQKEQQELALQQSEKRLETASEIARLGYWKFDIRSEVLSWSDKVYQIWGRSRNEIELTFDFFYESIHPDDRELLDLEREASLSGQAEMDFVHRIYLPDGSIRWVREQGRLNRDAEGNPISLEGTVQDISEQREEEHQLKLLESVVTHTHDSVMITDTGPLEGEGPKIVYVNKAFTQMTGYKPEEVLGCTPDILRGPKTDMKELEQFYTKLTRGESAETVVINYRKNGAPYWINISASPVKDIKGTVSHYIAIQRDVTDKIDAQLEKDLLAKISYSFKEKAGLGSSLEHICKLVTHYGDFTFCEAWLPSIHKNCLRMAAKFGKMGAGETFYRHSGDMREIAFGTGLPGTVWKSSQPVLWGNIDSNHLFIRRDAAKQSGIKSVLGIPLKYQGKTVGVLVVGTKEGEKQFKAHYPVLSRLEDYLGSEIKRKRLEEDISHLVETLPDLICLLDFQGNFLKMNKAGSKILGYSEAEVVGNSYQKFIYKEDQDVPDELVQKLVRGQETFEIENRYITKSGNLVWLSWHCKVVMEEGVVYAIAKDVTKAKKLQEVVSDASRLAKIGGWEIDMIREKLTWSDGVHQIYETDPNYYEPMLEEAIDFYREDYRQKVRQIINRAMAEGEAFDYEAAFISAKGNEKWVRAMGRAETVNGKCIRMYGSFQDITLHKEAELRLLAISNDLPGVTYQYFMYPDGSDKMHAVSQKAHDVYNLSPEQCEENAQLIWDRVKKGGDYEALMEDINISLETLSQWHSRWRYVLPNGEIRWHEGYGTPYKLADGTILFNSMVFDITDKVRLTNLLEETSELSQIGSWEMDLFSKPGTDAMYWSPIVRKIVEVDEHYDASLNGGLEFYTPESRAIVEKAIQDLIEAGKEYDEEVLLKTSSGKEKWVRIIGKCERPEGVCSKIYGSIQDIHAMKTTQLQLEEILGSISDAFYAVDKDWNFTYFNREAENLLGMKSEEVLRKNIWESLSAVQGTELETVYKRVAKKGIAESFVYLYPANGSWYEINTYPSNGGLSVYFKNIDERKKAEVALKAAFREKNMILESIGDAFFAMKEDFTVTYWNKKAEQLIGVKREELIGKNLWDVFPEAMDLPSYTNYNKVLKSRKPITFEDYYGLWLEVNAYPSEEGISVFFRDITQRKKANEKILHKTKQLDIIAEMNAALLAYDDWQQVIAKTFGKVGECLELDRVYYFQNAINDESGELETSQRLVWNSRNESCQIADPRFQHVALSRIRDFSGPLMQEEAFSAIVSNLQPSETKTFLLQQDIQSILVLPLYINKMFWGFIGFDDCKNERVWSQDDISFLNTITTNLSVAIESSLTDQELQRSKKIYQDLFDFSPQPMWIYDPSTLYFLNVNKAAISKYGYSLDEFRQMTIKEIRPDSQLESLEKSMKIRNGKVWDSYAGVFLHSLKSGEHIWVEIYSNDIEYEGRTVRLVLASDITEKQEYISTIEAQNQKLRDIAWTQSHVVRAPLSRILGVINLLDLEPDDSGDIPFLLEQIKASGVELDTIVQKIVAETRAMDIKTTNLG